MMPSPETPTPPAREPNYHQITIKVSTNKCRGNRYRARATILGVKFTAEAPTEKEATEKVTALTKHFLAANKHKNSDHDGFAARVIVPESAQATV
jgi:hypothetical protein